MKLFLPSHSVSYMPGLIDSIASFKITLQKYPRRRLPQLSGTLLKLLNREKMSMKLIIKIIVIRITRRQAYGTKGNKCNFV